MHNPHKNLHLQRAEAKSDASLDRSSRAPPVKGGGGRGGETPPEEEAVRPPHHNLEVLDTGICRRRRQEVEEDVTSGKPLPPRRSCPPARAPCWEREGAGVSWRRQCCGGGGVVAPSSADSSSLAEERLTGIRSGGGEERNGRGEDEMRTRRADPTTATLYLSRSPW
jgi:hypothetical protein